MGILTMPELLIVMLVLGILWLLLEMLGIRIMPGMLLELLLGMLLEMILQLLGIMLLKLMLGMKMKLVLELLL